jgi:hypothetical protein
MWTLWWHAGGPGARWVRVFAGSEAQAREMYQCCASGQRTGSLMLMDERQRPVVRRQFMAPRGVPWR